MCWGRVPSADDGDELGERAAPCLCRGWPLSLQRYRDLHILDAWFAAMAANCVPRMGFRTD